MKVECIALDLDRTTLNSEGKLSEANIEAIEKAAKKGVHIVIASGRAFDSLPQDIFEVKGIEYAITSNGAAIYDFRTKECVHKYFISEKAILEILASVEYDDVTFEVFIEGRAFAPKEYVENPVMFGATESAVSYVQRTRNKVEYIKEFILNNKERIESLDIIVKTEVDKKRIWEKLKTDVTEVYITSSVRQLIEISNEKAGKKSGIEYTLKHLGISRDKVAAFGDADNDSEMLESVGYGIAMENANENCKKVAKYITKHHNDDGVAFGILNILGI